MTELTRIADQLERAFTGPAWHGPSVLEAFAGVTARQAATRPISNMHSIWEITLHIAAWTGAVCDRLATGQAVLPKEGDWPAVTDASGTGWENTLALLQERHAALQAALSSLTDERLAEKFGDNYDPPTASGFSVYQTLHGIIQHHLYHAGQLVLLRKMLK